jgi:hypothetical protein
MNKIKINKLTESGAIAFALLAVLAVGTVGTVSAKERKPKPKKSSTASLVVAHIPFSGLSVVDMAMQKQSGEKLYLYVQHGREEGVSVVDVSEPGKSNVVRTVPWPNAQLSNRMNVLGDVAIIRETDDLSVRASASKDEVVLWDLSNPAAPRELQRFSGVVKVLEDDRNFIYVLNTEGLWVISEPDRKPQQDSSPAYGG